MCTGTSGDMGTCWTTTECSSKGGKVEGNCAAGFGVCCIFSYSACGSTISQNISYITNPNYPTAYTVSSTGSCSYSINPLNSDICQLRLDFDSFSLASSTTDGSCVDTMAITTGSGQFYPNLCGINTGHHIYLDTGRTTTSQTLAFTVAAAGSATYKIKVSQIECYASYAAPPGCLQYYTGSTGRVKSFNRANGKMLHNLIYNACVRRESGSCGITWSVTDTTEYAPLATYKLGDGAIAVHSTAAIAKTAYISIPQSFGALYSGGTFSDQLTDESPGTVTSNGVNYELGVFSTNAAQTMTDGFDLTYNQGACISSTNIVSTQSVA